MTQCTCDSAVYVALVVAPRCLTSVVLQSATLGETALHVAAEAGWSGVFPVAAADAIWSRQSAGSNNVAQSES